MKSLPFLSIAMALLMGGCANVESHTSPHFASSYREPIYDATQVSVRPRLVRGPAIKTPPSLSSPGSQASALLTVIVKPDGSAVVEAVKAQSEGPFTLAAIEAIQASLYSPGLLNGHKVATRIEVPVALNWRGGNLTRTINEHAPNQPFGVSTPNTTPDMDRWGHY